MIRIFIAEDQVLVRDALATLLNFEDDFEVIGTAGTGVEAVKLALALQPDIALLDVEMPEMSGLEVVEQLQQKLPTCKAIVLTTFARPGYMQRAIKAGAQGYLLKDTEVGELSKAIRCVVQGQRMMAPELMVAAIEKANPLTEREIEILRLAAEGGTTRALARQLSLSEGTVRNYLSEIFSKLGTSSRQEALKLAEDQGWI